MPRIHDAFLFYNELDLLEIRLHELFPVVDQFILVEGSKSFSGNDKPPLFAENRERYAPYLSKLRYIYVEDWPDTDDPWKREHHQRNALMRGSQELADDDFIIFSDVDEIPSREAVAKLRYTSSPACAFEQRFSYFKLDYIRGPLPLQHRCWSIAERRGTMRDHTAQERRDARFPRVSAFDAGQSPNEAGIEVLTPVGWHASYLGDAEFVRNKIRNFSHQEFNDPSFLASIDLDRIISDRGDLYNRPNEEWLLVDEPITVPHLVREQPERFAHLLIDMRNLRP